MELRTLGRTGVLVGAIGLGTEYLLNQPQEIATAVIQRAVDRDVTYFDTFWPQPWFRDKIGVAVKGLRDRIMLAGHLGAVMIGEQAGVSRDPVESKLFFDDYLARVGTDYVDVVMLHNCNTPEDLERLMAPGGLLDLARSLRVDGKARFIGMSGHNTVTARQAVESGAIDLLMFPVNLASHAIPGTTELFAACVRHNVGVVAMKPYAGGNLLSKQVTIYVEDFQIGRQEMPGAPTRFEKPAVITATQCLSYVLSQQGLTTAVPGCKSVEELDAALAYLDASEEDRVYAHLLPAFSDLATGECVYCNHCLPCPAGIDIGRVLSLMAQVRGKLPPAVCVPDARAAYSALEANAGDCLACGICTTRCPFGVDVVTQMEAAGGTFA